MSDYEEHLDGDHNDTGKANSPECTDCLFRRSKAHNWLVGSMWGFLAIITLVAIILYFTSYNNWPQFIVISVPIFLIIYSILLGKINLFDWTPTKAMSYMRGFIASSVLLCGLLISLVDPNILYRYFRESEENLEFTDIESFLPDTIHNEDILLFQAGGSVIYSCDVGYLRKNKIVTLPWSKLDGNPKIIVSFIGDVSGAPCFQSTGMSWRREGALSLKRNANTKRCLVNL